MIPREEQRPYADALVRLLTYDLPEAVWTVGGNEGLVGHIPAYTAGPGPRRAQLRAWADFLNAEIDVTRYDNHPGGSAEAVGEFEEMRVRVWSPFAKRELPKTGDAQPSVRGGPDIGPEGDADYRAEQDDQP